MPDHRDCLCHCEPWHDRDCPDHLVRKLRCIKCLPLVGTLSISPGYSTFTLVFDDNVIDNCVWNHNRQQIKLWCGPFRIPIRVSRSFASGSRKIFVTPLRKLPPNKRFTLAVSPDLTSKSGCKLGNTAIFHFGSVCDRVSRPVRRSLRRLEE